LPKSKVDFKVMIKMACLFLLSSCVKSGSIWLEMLIGQTKSFFYLLSKKMLKLRIYQEILVEIVNLDYWSLAFIRKGKWSLSQKIIIKHITMQICYFKIYTFHPFEKSEFKNIFRNGRWPKQTRDQRIFCSCFEVWINY
jgi:hypothetical protein